MLKNVIKRDGRIEPFEAAKLNHWAIWAGADLGERVKWSRIVSGALRKCKEEETTAQLQHYLRRECIRQKSWPYSIMAGRLLTSDLRKEMYGGEIPTLKDMHTTMRLLGLMQPWDYTDDEYVALEEAIDHDLDFQMAEFQIRQIVNKYSLADRTKGVRYETPQFVFMRMAMALALLDAPGPKRVDEVIAYYKAFGGSEHGSTVNAPTPNYMNLGTGHNGLASCCLYTVADNARSIAVGNHIANTMTYMSAGIGAHYNLRGVGEPVRGGMIEHQGQKFYQRALAGEVKANTQGGRGGSATSYYSAFNPEAKLITNFQNPRTPINEQIRDLHFAWQANAFLVKKAALNEDVFEFTPRTAPELTQAFFSGDKDSFEKIYLQHEQDPDFKKNMVSARSLLVHTMQQRREVATLYVAMMDEINRHTPFLDTIYSSNLCVAGDTLVLTARGEIPIKDLVNKEVSVWNGHEYSIVTVRRTGSDRPMWLVVLDNGRYLRCTAEHKWYPIDMYGDEIETRTNELRPGMILDKWKIPGQDVEEARILKVMPDVVIGNTYCFTEPKRGRGVFNGILTGNCAEITEPTKPYSDMRELMYDQDAGEITFTCRKPGSSTTLSRTYNYNEPALINGRLAMIGTAQPGDTIHYGTAVEVVDVINRHEGGEVATCSLGGIVISHIPDDRDDLYEEACYRALKMIDRCIYLSDYELPHVGYTAKNRMNAGVGILGLAEHMARKKLKYNTPEGLAEIHRVAERHAYFMIRASLKISKERGVAPWMAKTKWPQGWLPIDTYKKTVDEITPPLYRYDWEGLRAQIIDNGGIGHSCLIAHMPTESSSKASGVPNSVYPVRDLNLKKTDASNALDWCAPDNDILEHDYQLAWDLSITEQIKFYAVLQKFADQAISADTYEDRTETYIDEHGDEVPLPISDDTMIQETIAMARYGVKTLYYHNSLTTEKVKKTMDAIERLLHEEHPAQQAPAEESSDSRGCDSGVCTL